MNNGKKKKMSVKNFVFHAVNCSVFALFALLCALPFYYVLVNSISDNELVAKGTLLLYPRGIHFQNLIDIFQLSGFLQAQLVTYTRTLLGTCFSIIGAMVVGYGMSRKECWHRKLLYRYFIITMYFSAGLIPGYLNMRDLGLLNTFWVYVVGSFTGAYNMVLAKTFIENIPASLEEAAIMDGGGYFVRFVRIILPLSKPIIATIAIFSAVGHMNDYMTTVLYTTSPGLRTMQAILYQYMNKSNMLAEMIKSGNSDMAEQLAKNLNPESVRYAIVCVTILPIMLIYPFFQKYFAKGIMIGAVKG